MVPSDEIQKFVSVGGSKWLPGSLSGSLATRNSDLSGFRPIFGQTWPQNPSRTTGLVLQCRLHQKSAPQTNSKAISWQFGILKSPPQGTAEYSMLRNSASGPGIGRILAGLLPGKHRNRPSGRPSAGRKPDFEVFSMRIRPKSSPEAQFPARKHYCIPIRPPCG